LVTSKNDGSQSVITLPQASNTQGGTISAVDYQKLQNSGVPIFTNEVLGAIKGSTEDGKISANADGTGTANGLALTQTRTNELYKKAPIRFSVGADANGISVIGESAQSNNLVATLTPVDN